MRLTVDVEKKLERVYVLHPKGSIDGTSYTILASEVDALIAKNPRLVIFDLKDVHFVSSAGLGVVLVAEQKMKELGGNTLMVNLQPQIRKVFDIVKMLPPEQMLGSIEDLDRYLEEIQRKSS